MGSIVVEKSGRLFGNIKVQGSKNAVLPIIAATIMINGVCVLDNCPCITDVEDMCGILENMGCRVLYNDGTLTIDSTQICNSSLVSDLTKKIRASSIIAGPVLGRFGHTKISQPGGCMIGKRPLDVHMEAFKKLGAAVTIINDESNIYYDISGNNLTGAEIHLRIPSVGATENIVMAAALANGRTVVFNAAMEPEIVSLCDFLKKAGAKIAGEGSSVIVIDGVKKLHGISYTVPVDRMAAGTYACAVLNNGGDVLLQGTHACDLTGFIGVLMAMGADMKYDDDGLRIVAHKRPCAVNYVYTAPYPEFPTDMQPIVMSVLARADGNSVIKENIFENRLGNIRFLNDMGADISQHGNIASIKGVNELHGRTVCALDLRSAAALVIAGLGASGTTVIRNADYIKRGYSDFCTDLRSIGAEVQWKKQ